jgi:hypothetical protein
VTDWATAISCQLRTGPSSPWWSTVLQGPQFCATHWVAQALRLAHTLFTGADKNPGGRSQTPRARAIGICPRRAALGRAWGRVGACLWRRWGGRVAIDRVLGVLVGAVLGHGDGRVALR